MSWDETTLNLGEGQFPDLEALSRVIAEWSGLDITWAKLAGIGDLSPPAGPGARPLRVAMAAENGTKLSDCAAERADPEIARIAAIVGVNTRSKALFDYPEMQA